MAIDQAAPLASVPDFGTSEMQQDERMSAVRAALQQRKL